MVPTASGSAAVRHLVLAPPRSLRVVAAFPAAAYLADPTTGRVRLALVARDGIAHPNALVLTAPTAARPLRGLAPGSRVEVGDGGVRVGQRRIRVTRWFDPRPVLPAVDPTDLDRRARATSRLVAAADPPLETGLEPGVRTFAAALVARSSAGVDTAARGLLGRGPGLTPAGDDLLAGALATWVLLGGRLAGLDGAIAALLDRAERATTAVSASLLRHAAVGEVADPAAVFLRALAGRGEARWAATRLLAVGATSGRDLAVGILAGVDAHLATHPTSSPSRPTSSPSRPTSSPSRPWGPPCRPPGPARSASPVPA
jgi:hypothetical protein